MGTWRKGLRLPCSPLVDFDGFYAVPRMMGWLPLRQILSLRLSAQICVSSSELLAGVGSFERPQKSVGGREATCGFPAA